jgi:hypothetical protein
MAVGHPVAADEPDPSMARVVTGQSKPSECLSAIAVNRVDGAQRSLSNQAFNLEPGRHSLAGPVLLDTRFCPVPDGTQRDRVPPLESSFEAGRTYYVGFDHSAPERRDWKYVVWKVE